MNPQQLKSDLAAALADRQLLDHPFYRRWVAGELRLSDLASYAAQYRCFEAALPGLLRGLESGLDSGAARELVRRNLADEESNPEPHVQLFARFADAVGAPADAAASAATATLLDTYRRLISESAVHGLAAFVAYEMQAPAIAASKAAGLREKHGLNAAATEFWDVHADMDVAHADWTIAALAAMTVESEDVLASAGCAADAWWAFLDEQQAQSQTLVA